MIYRLWLSLSHFFDFKLELNVNCVGTAKGIGGGKPPHVMVVHRSYRVRGGEDYFLTEILIPALLALNVSFEVVGFPALFSNPKFRLIDCLEVIFMALGLEKWRPSYLEMMRRLRKTPPTHVIFNNFIPTISLRAPELAKRSGAKTFAWLHNFRLSCANGLLFNGKAECHKCVEKGSHWAVIQSCFPTRKQGILYALIYRKSRVMKSTLHSIDEFITVSEYVAGEVATLTTPGNDKPTLRVIRHPTAKVLPTVLRLSVVQQNICDVAKKLPQPFFTFMGRLSYEKGADRILGLSKKYPDKGFLVCGDGPLMDTLKKQKSSNLALVGVVGDEEKQWIFQNTAALLILSRVPETSSLIIAESDPYGTPVVYPKDGGAEETFKWLARAGCELQSFKGQSFDRTVSTGLASADAFNGKFAELVGVSAVDSK